MIVDTIIKMFTEEDSSTTKKSKLQANLQIIIQLLLLIVYHLMAKVYTDVKLNISLVVFINIILLAEVIMLSYAN